MAKISLGTVTGFVKEIEVEIGLPPAEDGSPQTLTVGYRPSIVTPAQQAKLQAVSQQEGDEALRGYFGFLTQLIARWGLEGPLTDADGQIVVADGAPVPVAVETFQVLPAALTKAITAACMADIGDPKSSTAS